jgi:hypothetical protein
MPSSYCYYLPMNTYLQINVYSLSVSEVSLKCFNYQQKYNLQQKSLMKRQFLAYFLYFEKKNESSFYAVCVYLPLLIFDS